MFQGQPELHKGKTTELAIETEERVEDKCLCCRANQSSIKGRRRGLLETEEQTKRGRQGFNPLWYKTKTQQDQLSVQDSVAENTATKKYTVYYCKYVNLTLDVQ